MNNKSCGVYPCELERESIYYDTDGSSGAKTLKKVRIVRVNIYLVVTETTMLVLEVDQSIKNVAKLTSWATLSALEKIRHRLEPDDFIQFFWRRLPDQKEPWVLNVQMNQNSNDCMECIKRNLKKSQVEFSKTYEKKRKFKQSDVDSSSMQNRNIDKIIERINHFEKEVEQDCTPKNAQLLIAHYNKAIEYYATFDDDQHMEWLMKLQKIFWNENI